MRYVSFDVANKSLAISIINIEHTLNITKKIEEAFCEYKKNKKKYLKKNQPNSIATEYYTLLKKCNDVLNCRIFIEYLNVIDLIPGKKISETTIVERTFFLDKALKTLKEKIPDNNFKFLIEYQMGPNDKSRTVSSQLIMFCTSFMNDAEDAKNRIKLVGPSLKNKLFIEGDEESYHAFYLSKFKSNYTANKNHTKYMLKKIVKIYNQNNIIKEIKKKNIDDAADSVCMAIAYFIFNEL